MSDNIRPIKRVSSRPTGGTARRVLRVAGRLLAMVLALAVLAGLGWLLFRLSDQARSLFEFIVRYSAYAYAVHLALTVGLWLGWDQVVAQLVTRGLVPEHARAALLKPKGRWCFTLLMLQLVLLATAISPPA